MKVKNRIAKSILIVLSFTIASCSTDHGAEKKIITEIEKIIKDAGTGNPDAQFKLGFKYYFGDQVGMNKDSAEYWLKMAADNGHVEAKKTYAAFFTIIPNINRKDSLK